MGRLVRRKISHNVTDVAATATATTSAVFDLTKLPDDTLIQLFSLLHYRDRASLASTCRHCRTLSFTASLWHSLDLRYHRFDAAAAKALSQRCSELTVLRFSGDDAADAVFHLRARNLREIYGDHCSKLSSPTLRVIARRHELLETLVLGPGLCKTVGSDAVRAVAKCCPKLRKLWLCGVKQINCDAIYALAGNCANLIDLGFVDGWNVDVTALADVCSLRYLSVAGTLGLNWRLVSDLWSKLPNLVGLDVSRTTIIPSVVSGLLSCSQSLRVLCAINCYFVGRNNTFVTSFSNEGWFSKGKLLVSDFSDTCKGVGYLFADNSMKGKNDWRASESKDEKLVEMMTWLEWILSHSLLQILKKSRQGLGEFWVIQGATLLLNLIQSSQEDVQERAATALASIVDMDDGQIAEVIVRDGGVKLFLRLACSYSEQLQAESAKALTKLSLNAKFAKAVAEGGGTTILANLARSMNRLVAEEAAEGLWNLSIKGAIAEAGGVKALVDLIVKCPPAGDRVLERAAGALANLAADETCRSEVAAAGGLVHALVMLARSCKCEGVLKQAAQALSYLPASATGDSNTSTSAVGQESGAVETLLQLTHSPHEGVRENATHALWKLSSDGHNREAIEAAGGVKALVALVQSFSTASPDLQESVAGALWVLSDSEANCIAIRQEGGVAPLIAMARSKATNVREPAAGALWNLAFDPRNALCIVEEDGVSALARLCSTAVPKKTRFMAALALAYMFDGRMDEVVPGGASSKSISIYKSLDDARRIALDHIEAFMLTIYKSRAFAAAATSSVPGALIHATKAARVEKAAELLCSGAKIEGFVTMLRNPSPILKACAAFALLQFTMPGNCHAPHHANLLQNIGGARALRAAAAAATAPLTAKFFAKLALHNLSYHMGITSL